MQHYPRIELRRYPDYAPLIPQEHIQFLTFAGGEPHVQIDAEGLAILDKWMYLDVVVDFRFRNAVDLQFVVLLGDILQRRNVRPHLFMPYIPGGRQDRPTTPGSPFSAEVFMKMLGIVEWESVVVIEPHSAAALDQVKYFVPRWKHMLHVIPASVPKWWPKNKYAAVVSPDAGAWVRSRKIADDLGGLPIIQLEKTRNPMTGSLDGFKFPNDEIPSLPKGTYLLFDDICDGGGTFNGVADLLDTHYRSQYGFTSDIDLYVAHGIFSKGTDELFEHFTTIYSTTSWRTKQELDDMDVIAVPLYDGEQL